MSKILTLAKRELAGYFFSPMAYVIGAVFLCVCGFRFAPPPDFWGGSRAWFILVPAQQASFRALFEMMGLAMTVAAPLMTMRLVSEEVRSGTVETLLTAPVTDTQVILGKFFGVFGFYLALLASTLVFLVLMFTYARPDGGVVAMGYLGMMLMGAAFLSVGVFTSTLTRYQLLSAAMAIILLSILALLAEPLAGHLPAPWNRLVVRLDAMAYLRRFSRGLLDSQSLVYFLSITIAFLYLSVKSLESRRWR